VAPPRPLRIHVEPTLEHASLVAAFEGWNDAGESATSAVQYIDAAISSVPLAEIDGEDFLDLTVRRPVVHFGEDGRREIEWPATRFRYGAHDTSRELVVVEGVEPHLQWRRYCDLFAEVVQRLAIRRVVLLGAYVADVVYSLPVGVTGFASSDALLEQIGVQPSAYEGPTGIVGVLAERLRLDGVEVLSLWAGLPHYISATPNPRGALALVQKLTEATGIVIDTGPLEREAASFEEKISALVASDPELSEYVRQLKKREFAQ
jgi:predicted ATP-grasp superfamily ATP-dependent carboligase